MSIDKSLKIRGQLVRMRNVLTRAERLAVMEERRQWKDGDPIYGLPKTKIAKVKKAAKKKKEEAAAGATAEGAVAGAAPAEAAAPAKGAAKAAEPKAADKKGGKK